jgi:hypothetical protein
MDLRGSFVSSLTPQPGIATPLNQSHRHALDLICSPHFLRYWIQLTFLEYAQWNQHGDIPNRRPSNLFKIGRSSTSQHSPSALFMTIWVPTCRFGLQHSSRKVSCMLPFALWFKKFPEEPYSKFGVNSNDLKMDILPSDHNFETRTCSRSSRRSAGKHNRWDSRTVNFFWLIVWQCFYPDLRLPRAVEFCIKPLFASVRNSQQS